MKTTRNNPTQKSLKKSYVSPTLELIKLDTEIALVMSSDIVPVHPMLPEAPIVQKIFKFGW
jgi:hypothetical protein